VDPFIARENIKHFRERLWTEGDPKVRARLRELLLAEENKLAASLELLADVDRHISDGHNRIEKQRAIIATLELNGSAGLAQARLLLATLMESQALHEDYRQRVMIKIDQNRL
jgi:hypothetical protein